MEEMFTYLHYSTAAITRAFHNEIPKDQIIGKFASNLEHWVPGY